MSDPGNSHADPHETTRLIQLAAEGDSEAVSQLLPLVYDGLRAIAGAQFRGRFDQTLQPTALVHEAFLRMASQDAGAFKSREHFCAVASMAMRQILTDHARRRRSRKRGGDRGREELSHIDAPSDDADDSASDDLVALHDALEKLARLDPRRHRVVELRFLCGVSVEETASLLNVSERTVELDWRAARAWLKKEMAEE